LFKDLIQLNVITVIPGTRVKRKINHSLASRFWMIIGFVFGGVLPPLRLVAFEATLLPHPQI